MAIWSRGLSGIFWGAWFGGWWCEEAESGFRCVSCGKPGREGTSFGNLFQKLVEGELAFEEPTCGAPVPVDLCGVADGLKEVGFEIGLGVGEFQSELGVASGGVGNGGRDAADAPGGSSSAASGGEECENAFFLVVSKDRGPTRLSRGVFGVGSRVGRGGGRVDG